MKIKTDSVRTISCQELDRVVCEIYGRPYCFQQQDGCKSRGIHKISVPCEVWDYDNDTVSEVVNGEEMGVSFESWLKRDPSQPLGNKKETGYGLNLWWIRNFYPSLEMIIDDLYKKEVIEEGDYIIIIDW